MEAKLRNKTNNSASTTSSPNYSVSPQGRLGRFVENIKRKHEALDTTISSKIIHTLTPNSKNKDFRQTGIALEEDVADSEFRCDFGQLLSAKDFSNQEDVKLRENLICKIKKVCDEFRLSDDTFYRAVFLYDYQERVKLAKGQIRYRSMQS